MSRFANLHRRLRQLRRDVLFFIVSAPISKNVTPRGAHRRKSWLLRASQTSSQPPMSIAAASVHDKLDEAELKLVHASALVSALFRLSFGCTVTTLCPTLWSGDTYRPVLMGHPRVWATTTTTTTTTTKTSPASSVVKGLDLKCKGPRFDSRGAPEGFSHTGQGKLFGLS
jgi:hypothetical protein